MSVRKLTAHRWRINWRASARSIIGAALPTTVVVWAGSSQLDGTPILLVAHRVADPSDNRKTGDMIQLSIMRADMSPIDAWAAGQDGAVCPSACDHRSKLRGGKGTCYVNKARLSDSWAAARRAVDAGRIGVPVEFFKGARLRCGMEGDPAAVPLDVWAPILDAAQAHTGYTAAWRTLPREWSRYFMASVASPADYLRARSAGWSPFAASASAADDQDYAAAGASICKAERPAAPMACVDCLGCNGSRSSDTGRAGFHLPMHGAIGAVVRKRNNASA
jgi:hypothetical protein